jgi:hypothetical protein
MWRKGDRILGENTVELQEEGWRLCEWERQSTRSNLLVAYTKAHALNVFLFALPNWIYLPDTMLHCRARRWIRRPGRIIVCLITLAQICCTLADNSFEWEGDKVRERRNDVSSIPQISISRFYVKIVTSKYSRTRRAGKRKSDEERSEQLRRIFS